VAAKLFHVDRWIDRYDKANSHISQFYECNSHCELHHTPTSDVFMINDRDAFPIYSQNARKDIKCKAFKSVIKHSALIWGTKKEKHESKLGSEKSCVKTETDRLDSRGTA
jgi:hypothetical protein